MTPSPATIGLLGRYLLAIATSWLSAKGVISDSMATQLAAEPLLIDLAVAVIGYAATAVWYVYSRSRAALKEALGK